jgi:uncharacterized membrane protein YcaP (DUF421 family)
MRSADCREHSEIEAAWLEPNGRINIITFRR